MDSERMGRTQNTQDCLVGRLKFSFFLFFFFFFSPPPPHAIKPKYRSTPFAMHMGPAIIYVQGNHTSNHRRLSMPVFINSSSEQRLCTRCCRPIFVAPVATFGVRTIYMLRIFPPRAIRHWRPGGETRSGHATGAYTQDVYTRNAAFGCFLPHKDREQLSTGGRVTRISWCSSWWVY